MSHGAIFGGDAATGQLSTVVGSASLGIPCLPTHAVSAHALFARSSPYPVCRESTVNVPALTCRAASTPLDPDV
eukprot:27804-Eustigmatos_ZCMA.PRE.1